MLVKMKIINTKKNRELKMGVKEVNAALWHACCYFIILAHLQASESWVHYLLQGFCESLKSHLIKTTTHFHTIFTNTSWGVPISNL